MVEEWGRAKLGDLVTTQKGFAFKSGWYSDAGRPIVKVSDFTEDSVDSSGLVCIPEEIAADHLKYELEVGDVVIQTVGSWPSNPASVVGKCVRIPESVAGALLNQNAVKLTPSKRLDSNFLYYLLRNEGFKTYIVGTAQGAASQAAITLEAIRAYEFSFPSFLDQCRIAGILSAYDGLIENNLRRIQILEEMVRTLYCEWFVHFRFPGHESLPRIASPLGPIPKGCVVLRLEDTCDSIQDGDWIETKDQGGEDYRLVQISNIGVGDFIETGNYRFVTQDTFERLRCSEIKPGDILIARMPTPIGRAWLAYEMPWKMITAVDVAIIRTRHEMLDPMFLSIAWNDDVNLKRIAAHASGTTRPRVTRRELAGLEFVIPHIDLQLRFANLAGPQLVLARTLRARNDNLRHTRDLLLPRLLSGQTELTS